LSFQLDPSLPKIPFTLNHQLWLRVQKHKGDQEVWTEGQSDQSMQADQPPPNAKFSFKIEEGHYRTLEDLVEKMNQRISALDEQMGEQCQVLVGQDNRVTVSLGDQYQFRWPAGLKKAKDLGTMLGFA